MMKQTLMIFLVLTASSILFSVDITTLDGTVYKNAKVVNTMPDGILISFIGESDFDTVKLVKFKDLPADIQKKYGFNSLKAKKFEQEHQKWLDEQQEIAVKRSLKVKKSNIDNKKNISSLAKINTGEADTALDDLEKNSSSSQQNKAKLNELMSKLDNTMGNQQTGTEDESSISGLVHEMVSSTEEQVKEINTLTKDGNTE